MSQGSCSLSSHTTLTKILNQQIEQNESLGIDKKKLESDQMKLLNLLRLKDESMKEMEKTLQFQERQISKERERLNEPNKKLAINLIFNFLNKQEAKLTLQTMLKFRDFLFSCKRVEAQNSINLKDQKICEMNKAFTYYDYINRQKQKKIGINIIYNLISKQHTKSQFQSLIGILEMKYQNNICQLSEILTQMREKNNSLEDENVKLSSQTNSLKNMINQQLEQIQQQQQQEQIYEDKIHQLLQLFEETKKIQQKNHQLSQKVQCLEQRNQELLDQISINEQNYENARQILMAQMQKINQENIMLQAQLSNIQRLQQSRISVSSQESTQKNTSPSSIDIEQLKRLKNQNNELTKEAIKLNEEQIEMKNLIKKQQEQIQTLSAQKQTYEEKIQQLLKLVEESHLIQQRDHSLSLKLQQAEQKNQQLLQQTQLFEQNFENAKKNFYIQIQKLSKDKELLQSQLEQNSQRINDQNNNNQQIIDDLKKAVADLNREKVNLMREMTLEHESKLRVEKEIKDQKVNIENYESELQNYQNQLELYVKVLKKMDEKNKFLEQQLDKQNQNA